jgi:hypothetical protein
MAANRSGLYFILVGFILCTAVFTLRVKNEMADFEVNNKAAQRLYNGETLYRTADGHWQFKYLPFSALLYLPLAFLPLPLAKALWFGLTVAASVLIIAISSKLIDNKYNTLFSPVLVTALVMGRFFLREIQLGQIKALIAFLLLVVTWLLARSKSPSAPAAGGAIGGLAAALKPYAVIIFPYFALRKMWSAFAAGSAVLILTPALFYGWKGNLIVLGEWRSSLASSTPVLFSSQDNISLIGFLMKRTHDLNLSLIIYAITLVLLGGLVLFLICRGRRVSQPSVLDGFLILALVPLLSPLGWDYTFLSFAPAVMLICRHGGEYRPFWKGFLVMNLLVIALSLYDLMGHRLYAAFMSSSILTLNFLILVGYLAYLRIKQHA